VYLIGAVNCYLNVFFLWSWTGNTTTISCPRGGAQGAVLTHFCPPFQHLLSSNLLSFAAPLKPLRDDSALRALLSLRGLKGAPEVPPLYLETSVSRTANVGTWLRKRNGGHEWVKMICMASIIEEARWKCRKLLT